MGKKEIGIIFLTSKSNLEILKVLDENKNAYVYVGRGGDGENPQFYKFDEWVLRRKRKNLLDEFDLLSSLLRLSMHTVFSVRGSINSK